MTYYHFLNCVVLAFGPSIIVYNVILNEYNFIKVSIFAGLAFLAAQLSELIVEGTLITAPEVETQFDIVRVVLRAMISSLDFLFIFLVLRKHTRYLDMITVGLAWSLTESVATRLFPLWMGARGLEFSYSHLKVAVEANFYLVIYLAVSTLIFLLMKKKGQTTLIRLALAFFLALKPTLNWIHFQDPESYALELAAQGLWAFVLAAFAWTSYKAAPNADETAKRK
uniref:BOS complex subunit TMEM147 n=1 Tax=Arcella intermedia TaxID=1963864 RepID=A0A6B2LH87_9EUKA|eukprot:TRINITY_DN24244_c0_g1_i1.p1 TRINITY_DN24244_c0_g1~~TRINITY_DN24244_c0_g1_i1.p1  ORF type:complete len:225 (-),score=1.50 TRINITY_DN24244_c0_g1_i1:18-692(-)